MDLTKVLAQLRLELADLNAAISSLERLQFEGKRRGRPPKALSAEKTEKASAASAEGEGAQEGAQEGTED